MEYEGEREMKIIRVGEKIQVELNPCPQCNREDLIFIGQGGPTALFNFRIKCVNCGYEIVDLSLQKAAKMWNRSEEEK